LQPSKKSKSKKPSKVEQAAILLGTLRFKILFEKMWNSEMSAEERIEFCRDFEAEMAYTKDHHPNPEEVKEGQAWFEFYQSCIRNSPDEVNRNLGRIALRVLSDAPDLLEYHCDTAVMLLKGNVKRKSKPRTWTPEVEEFVQILNRNHYDEINQAKDERDLYARQKKTARTIRQLISIAHPKMPDEILGQILRDVAPESAELAREWTAAELPKKFPKIKVAPNTLKGKTNVKAGVKADLDGSQSR
jgi:hypothetical protein